MKNTNDSRLRRIADIVGMLSSLLLLLLIIINFYVHVTPERWEIGFRFSSVSSVFAIILVVTIIVCTSISFITKSKRDPLQRK
ncbi:hypothetical protein MTQ94_11115 [Staphylococcus agnetis]|uniref:Uncharacterized protein n=1 Tax=Staphylococcus agnetis TaxID=985762 RepID=A0ABD7TTE0_9STAP|nr:hypothetical protein [Staphylococcus agnetis]MCO4339663.1 hypothetical protein [Staphylococcus agnetis]MCO4340113.1 hypothetical protein [Staphylococcus agnetis]MCO4344318.1 hypothetical protein [Staphylococcus agnetis]MCO4346551.1 hypothetical protein [Staphylococcus agnetis]MCO4347078.1 hypothetical protein [Staphylococcus agnetis]